MVSVLPLAFKLAGKPVLVVGAGRIGAGKAGLLVDAGAKVSVVARDVLAPLPTGIASLERRDYRRGDLDGFSLVVSATGDADTNDVIVDDARDAGVWLNVVDDPERSDFYFTALHRAGDVVVSVSSSGSSPALAQRLRTLIAEHLPANLADVAQRLRDERTTLQRAGASTEGRDWSSRIDALLADEPAGTRPR